MDDPAANQSRAPCRWAGLNGWSAAPPGRGSSYGHPSSQSYMSGHAPPPHHAPHGGHAPPAAAPFHSTALFGAAQMGSFGWQSARSSSAPRPSQGSQNASFQAPTANQSAAGGPGGRPSCRQTEPPGWSPPAPCRAAGEESLPDVTFDPRREERPGPEELDGGRRSTLMLQREQLLQRLALIEKVLEALPPEDGGDEKPPHSPAQPCLPAECPPPAVDEAREDQQAPAGPGGTEEYSIKAEEDNYPEFLPDSDDDLPGFKSDSDYSCSGQSDGRPSSPMDTKPGPEASPGPSSPPQTRPSRPQPQRTPGSGRRLKASETVVQPLRNSTTKPSQKKNYCLFCRKPMIKMSRHLERVHSDKVEVAAAFQHPKNSPERTKVWYKLINQGNFLHNKEVLKTGRGELVVRKRPRRVVQGTAFLHCPHCHGLFLKKFLFRHMKNCPQRDKAAAERRCGRRRIASRCALQTVGELDASDGVRDILGQMVYDQVTQTIMEDGVLLQFAQQMFDQYGSNANRHGYVRQNLRHIARLVMEARKTTPMKTLEDFFRPSNFARVVSAVNSLAGYDPDRKSFGVPSLALKLGYLLQKTCGIVQANARERGDARLARSAKTFLSEYQKKWTALISSSALTSLRDVKTQSDAQVPLARDVKRLHFHLENAHPPAERNLRERCSVENYTALCKVALGRIILFNQRKSKEVSHLKLQDFTSRKMSGALDHLDESISRLEETLCGFFARVDVRSSSGRMVPVLLKPSFVSALELLVSSRSACGIPEDNPFLFARPQALTPYRGTECILALVRECGAENPELLCLAAIRKHFGATLQLMNLDEPEARRIFGPNNDIQILRQDSNATLEDLKPESRARLQAGKERRTADGTGSGAASGGRRSAGAASSSGASRRTTSSRSQGEASHHKPKQKWQEEEVGAVERHLLRFITEHRVPQKDHCMQCLEAEPRALRGRTWRGVKDYVRNRITTLKRQKGSSASLWKNRYQPDDEEEEEEEED